jgi:hypothetical protein
LLFTESRDDLAELMELMAQTHGWLMVNVDGELSDILKYISISRY